MELLYNPDAMSEYEVKKTFVARQPLVDELESLIERQPDGAGAQHVVIIAPRGMGKTTVLLMVKYAIKDGRLAKHWQAVKFPEESYGVYDLADFWIEVLKLLAGETGDAGLRLQVEAFGKKYKKNDELQEASLAAIKDWRRKSGKRLVLLVENLDMILEQINDEQENARLRDVMMNDGTMLIIGGATTFFKEARAYDQPLYNFFKIDNLADLRFEQMLELLRRRAELDAVVNFEATLSANQSRLRVLEYFTGGNPRLVLMLYRVVTQSDITEVRRSLEKLLDEVTPYYKGKMETLPAQQRKILDHIARVSAKTNEGLKPSEIAQAVRLSPNQVSSQLKRLSEIGYVRAANIRGRSAFYTLSEPLYAIWHQMRFGQDAHQRMGWLVGFLKLWYAAEEFGMESERLEARFRDHLRANNSREAHDVLEHHRYLAEAAENWTIRANAMERVVCGYLDLKETETIKSELLRNIKLENLSEHILCRLIDADCITAEEMYLARASNTESDVPPMEKRFAEAMALAAASQIKEMPEDALRYVDQALEIRPENRHAWNWRGNALYSLERYDEAIASIDHALEIKPDDYWALEIRGDAYFGLNKYENALESYKRATAVKPDSHSAWCSSVAALNNLGRCEEALIVWDRAKETSSDCAETWFCHAFALTRLGRFDEALTSYDRSLTIEPTSWRAWSARGNVLSSLGRFPEAFASFDRSIEEKPDYYTAWDDKGDAYFELVRFAEAEESYKRATEIDPDRHSAWCSRMAALNNLGRCEEALAIWDRAKDTASGCAAVWYCYAFALDELGRHEEALASYDEALKIKTQDARTWSNRGSTLYSLGRFELAIASYDTALKIDSTDLISWGNRGNAYLRLFVDLVEQGQLEAATLRWREAMASGRRSDVEDWQGRASDALLTVAKMGHLNFARKLIAEAEMEDRLFPLARAIDYLQTGDEALIEKLSPEVKGIVKEVVAKLQTSVTKAVSMGSRRRHRVPTSTNGKKGG